MSILNQVMGAAGAASSSAVTYVEDVFSTSLYKGNGSTQTITNGINLAGKGGLVWGKARSAAYDNFLADSARGSSNLLYSNNTSYQQADANVISGFNANGFSLGIGGAVSSNTNNVSYASWTFRKQPKFFDVVTWTGDGTSNRQIAHSLGSTPGCIITKRLNALSNWSVWHRSSGAGFFAAALNLTGDFSSSGYGNTTAFTDTYFTVSNQTETNASGGTFVAYVFAHNAGGFGPLGTDNVISCGSFTASAGETATVTLGFEPQWLLFKPSSTTGDWQIVDTMRPWPVASDAFSLKPNLTSAEANGGAIKPSATGFYATSNLTANATYIYIAIRRPMKPPTTGTSVFSIDTTTATSDVVSTLSYPDLGLFRDRTTATNWFAADRLRGFSSAYYTPTLYLNTTAAEATPTTGDTITANGYVDKIYAGGAGVASNAPLLYSFKRAPGFFDIVCYTGTGSNTTVPHSLAVVPELVITKTRSNPQVWAAYCSYLPVPLDGDLRLNQTNAAGTVSGMWGATFFTTTTFSVGVYSNNNTGAYTYVAYLFATLAGVSKVGSYTGNGTSQTIACGFAAGARFIMIKRTDAVGDWYIWDTARGIIAGNDPHLSFNTTVAEVTTNDTIDPASSGFIVNQVADTNVNVSAAKYIFLAIA